jgi:hypothetical protein
MSPTSKPAKPGDTQKPISMGGRILQTSRLAGPVAALAADTGFVTQGEPGTTRISVQVTGGTFAGDQAEKGG